MKKWKNIPTTYNVRLDEVGIQKNFSLFVNIIIFRLKFRIEIQPYL